MLVTQDILSRGDAAKGLAALDALSQPASLVELQTVAYDGSCEDLFFLVEQRLAELCGPEAGGRMHTARSRNDIDMTIYRMVLRDHLLDLLEELNGLREGLLALSTLHRAALMPAYTHNQPAQPTTLGHYLLAYIEILERDAARLQAAYPRINRSPLGACAITTTGFPIDRQLTARLLGFEGLQLNSYGAIAAVDYLTEPCATIAVVMISLGRFVQDLLLWSTAEFGFLRLSAAFVQISSIMPQKRNPVALEHVRILASRALHDAQGVLGNLHNTPFADANDAEDPLQPIAWRTFDEAGRALKLLSALLSEAEFNIPRMARAADANFLPVTELADTLVRRTGRSFHEAHRLVSTVVHELTEAGIGYAADTFADRVMQLLAETPGDLSHDNVREALKASNFIAVRQVEGGPAPSALQTQQEHAQEALAADKRWLLGTRAALAGAREDLAHACVSRQQLTPAAVS